MKELSISKFNDIAKLSLKDSTFYDASYPDALSKFIINCEPPITIALQGEWGSGKTTMMNMVKERLENSCVDYMEFNPWLFSQFNLGDQLPLILLTHLSKETGFDDKFKDISKKLCVSAAHFFGKKVGGTDDFLLTLEPDDIEKLKNIKKEFTAAVEKRLIKKSKEKLLIFIDDIDRLSPPKAVELLESIKLFCESEKCVFVLAVDYDVILKGAKKKFEDDKGKVFFDKIIQVPFTMPISTSKFDKFMQSLLEDVLSNSSDEKIRKELSDIYIEISELCIGYNPRSVKRLLNTFVISDYVAMGQGLYIDDDNINGYIRSLLYILLCIENNNEDAYNFIMDLTEENGENVNINDYILKLENISKDEETDEKKEFYKALDLENNNYNTRIIGILKNVLSRLNDKKIGEQVINKIFNISLSTVSVKKNSEKKLSDDIIKFNNICNVELKKVLENINKNLNCNFKFEKGSNSNLQHKPTIYYLDSKTNVSARFMCIYDEYNQNIVNINLQYWGEKLIDKNKELYEKIRTLGLTNEQKDTTTGTQYKNWFSFKITKFDKLSKHIIENFKKITSVFN